MQIAEIYKSIQGEGRLTGTESVFVRTSGCNLRCWYCDTPYASWQPEGSDLSTSEILAQVKRWDVQHVVITGGEPMLFAELIPLCDSLRRSGKHITIETAGTLYLPVQCDLMSISPKLSNSAPPASEFPRWYRRHEESRQAADVICRLVDEFDHQFKFVIDSEDDLEEVLSYLDDHPEIGRQHVMLMPQARHVEEQQRIAEWLLPWCHSAGLQFCPRKQIEWYGLSRGT